MTAHAAIILRINFMVNPLRGKRRPAFFKEQQVSGYLVSGYLVSGYLRDSASIGYFTRARRAKRVAVA